MSYAEDMGYDAYDKDDIRAWRGRQRTKEVIVRGGELKRMCNDCGGFNVKKSSKGNWYCVDLCWTKETAPKPNPKGK